MRTNERPTVEGRSLIDTMDIDRRVHVLPISQSGILRWSASKTKMAGRASGHPSPLSRVAPVKPGGDTPTNQGDSAGYDLVLISKIGATGAEEASKLAVEVTKVLDPEDLVSKNVFKREVSLPNGKRRRFTDAFQTADDAARWIVSASLTPVNQEEADSNADESLGSLRFEPGSSTDPANKLVFIIVVPEQTKDDHILRRVIVSAGRPRIPTQSGE